MHDLKIEWAVIKAVSDYGDGSKQKTEKWQPFASAMAASVVHHMFKDPRVLNGWRRHKETGDTKGSYSFRPEYRQRGQVNCLMF